MLAAAVRSGLRARPGMMGLVMARSSGVSAVRAFSEEAAAQGITLTEKGAQRIKELQEKKGNSELMLRLSVEGGGCSGFSYVFDVTDKPPSAEDIVFEQHGTKVVVDDVSLDLVRGSKIDFTEDLIRRSFEVVDNPNAESGCGCGSSFAAKMDF
mmetsp:Transcript_11463/g.22525  ORF Transcript_11463/g.22525 Transcript_11463/m.22525 type:complete len:154 (+) Transcript_11463:129-590(+)